MNNESQTSHQRAFRLGIASFRFDPEVVERMLRSLEVPCETKRVEVVDKESLAPLDTVFLLNPTATDQQWDTILDHVQSGGTAIVLLSPSLTSHTETIPQLTRFGLRIGYTRRLKKLDLQYQDAYPVSHKRSNGDRMLFHEPSKLATFHSTAAATRHVPLIRGKMLFSRPCIAMQVDYGRGIVVFANSAGLPEDRADLVAHLLKTAADRKPTVSTCPPRPTAEVVIETTMTLFEVYDEIPLDVVARELSQKHSELDRLALLEVIEASIRGGELPARLRGDTIVKLW